jgi:hypothetical protein
MPKVDMFNGELQQRMTDRERKMQQPQTIQDIIKDRVETNRGDKSVLKEAQTIIYGDREKTYGHPAKNLEAIATMWNAYLKSVGDRALVEQDVCVMMVLLKGARLANDPSHRDSVVDICGYAALIERCEEKQ